jgi:prolyl-tRNA synthetase
VDEAIEAAQSGFARVPWSAVGIDGETKANQSAITVRCLVREDGSVPDSDDEAGMIAILARSY